MATGDLGHSPIVHDGIDFGGLSIARVAPAVSPVANTEVLGSKRELDHSLSSVSDFRHFLGLGHVRGIELLFGRSAPEVRDVESADSHGAFCLV